VADDYVVKPFSPKELEARHPAACCAAFETKDKLVGIPNSGVIRFKRTCASTPTNARCTATTRRIAHRMEFQACWSCSSGRSGEAVQPRCRSSKEVWGYTRRRHVDTRVVDVHILQAALQKLEDDPATPS